MYSEQIKGAMVVVLVECDGEGCIKAIRHEFSSGLVNHVGFTIRAEAYGWREVRSKNYCKGCLPKALADNLALEKAMWGPQEVDEIRNAARGSYGV